MKKKRRVRGVHLGRPKPTASKKPASTVVPYRKRGAFGPGATNAILDDGYQDYPASRYQLGYET